MLRLPFQLRFILGGMHTSGEDLIFRWDRLLTLLLWHNGKISKVRRTIAPSLMLCIAHQRFQTFLFPSSGFQTLLRLGYLRVLSTGQIVADLL